eukprot:gene11377-29653_t
MSSDWETCKENARPLKAGYKMKQLSSLLDTTVYQRDDLEQERSEHEAHCKANGGEDPLEHWRKYDQYKNDKKFLKICLMYADCCDDARETFTFLEQHGVGAQQVSIYHACDHKEAERVFETGIVTLANPRDVEQLTKIRAQYRERVADAARRRRDEPDAEDEGEAGRRALGDVRKTKRGRVAANRAPVRSRGGLASRSDGISRSQPQRSNNNGGIQIFEDPEGKHSSRNSSAVPVFSDLPQEAHMSKENAKSAGTWKGGIGTKAKSAAPVDFAVFQDESAASEPQEAKPAGSNRRNFERKALGNYKPKAPVVLLKDFAREQGTTRNVVGGYLKYDPVPIYGGKDEFSFEEIRGNAWLAQQKMLRANDVNELDEEMDLSSAPSPAHAAGFADSSTGNSAKKAAAVFGAFADDAEVGTALAPSTEVSSLDSTQPEYTITKQLNFDPAAEEEEAVLEAPAPSSASAATANDVADEVPAYTGYGADSPPMKSASSGEVTIHTKAAMADVMAMFASEPSGDASFLSAPKEQEIPAGSFEVFEDDTNDENQENCAPSAYAYAKPVTSAAQASTATLAADRSILQAASGFDDERAEGVGAGENNENTSTNEAGEDAVADAAARGMLDFDMVMQSVGLGLPPRAGGSYAAPANAASASSSFACFEDPPTGKVTMPVEMSFVASTPFGSAIENITEKPMITPIQTEQISLSRAAPGASSAWPPASGALNQLMAHVDFSDAGNCIVARGERLPALCLDQPVKLAGIEEEVTILTIDSETSTGKIFLGEIADEEGSNVIIKTASPPCPWEFHVLTTLHLRLKATPPGAANTGALMRSFPMPLSLHCYDNSHMFAMEYLDSHTLADVITMNQRLGRDMPEEMVMFYTLEMLKIMEGMHATKIVHGKFDSHAMKLRDDDYDGSLAITYSPGGKGGWASKGLRLTDFDRAVDFGRMPAGQQLTCRAGDWDDMAEYPSWTYHVDYHGLCNTVHRLLHRGEEMRVVQSDDDGSWSPAKTFKRYWQFGLWEQLFDGMLNVGVGEAAPLSTLRQSFESFFTQNPYKAKAIKQALLKQDTALENED